MRIKINGLREPRYRSGPHYRSPSPSIINPGDPLTRHWRGPVSRQWRIRHLPATHREIPTYMSVSGVTGFGYPLCSVADRRPDSRNSCLVELTLMGVCRPSGLRSRSD